MLRSECSICTLEDAFGSDDSGMSRAKAESQSNQPSVVALPPSMAKHATVWQVPYPADYSSLGSVKVLTQDDWAEIGALRSSAIRRRAFGMRIFLREALSTAVDAVAPRDWRFGRTVYGKPYVSCNSHNVEFSISHTNNASFLAISQTVRVGIDVAMQSVDDSHEIAALLFTRHERSMLNRASAAERAEMFLRIWTAKEAFAKLLGVGMALDAPANDCGVGTHLATWAVNTPEGRVVLSLAVDTPVDLRERPSRQSAA